MDVSEDGQRFLMIQRFEGDTAVSRVIDVVQGWSDVLEERVPTD
jgi:hypothetical protein